MEMLGSTKQGILPTWSDTERAEVVDLRNRIDVLAKRMGLYPYVRGDSVNFYGEKDKLSGRLQVNIITERYEDKRGDELLERIATAGKKQNPAMNLDPKPKISFVIFDSLTDMQACVAAAEQEIQSTWQSRTEAKTGWAK